MNLVIRPFRTTDQKRVIHLWDQCGLLVPWNNPEEDIQRKLADSPEMFIVGELDNEIIATCIFGYDGHRGWVYYLAVKPNQQRNKVATQMMSHVEEKLKRLGCPKINLMVRESNLGVRSFYHEIGYSDDSVITLSKRLLKDEPYIKGK